MSSGGALLLWVAIPPQSAEGRPIGANEAYFFPDHPLKRGRSTAYPADTAGRLMTVSDTAGSPSECNHPSS